VSLEGELRVRLALRDGRIAHVHLHSTRPDVAAALLQQRTAHELSAAVPRLFAVCGASQGVACRLALAAAAGAAPDDAVLEQCSAEVANEIVRESSRRALLDAPRFIGEQPSDGAVQAARIAMQWQTPQCDSASALALALAVFGMPGNEWLGLDTPAALAAWIAAGRTATARELQRLGDGDAAGRLAALLPATPPAHVHEWLPEPLAETDFARRPLWRGHPAETGALTRLQADPLVAALLGDDKARVLARHAARLRELAQLLRGERRTRAGVLDTPRGDGVAWVDNARGLLVHQVRLADGRAQAYRIVAPTEWNFHPDGPVPMALQGAPVADAGDAQRLARRLINSLDPCVVCHVETVDA
jgi:coenzyme F420-reducing hydrogenase alpha subunit